MTDYLMNPEYVKRMSPSTRVHNAYQALELGVQSGDPETDAYLREDLQQAFLRNGVRAEYYDQPTYTNRNTVRKMSKVLAEAGTNTAQKLQSEKLSHEQVDTIQSSINSESRRKPSFQKKVFQNYRRKYGVPVDALVGARNAAVVSDQLSLNLDEPALDSTASVMTDTTIAVAPDALAEIVTGNSSGVSPIAVEAVADATITTANIIAESSLDAFESSVHTTPTADELAELKEIHDQEERQALLDELNHEMNEMVDKEYNSQSNFQSSSHMAISGASHVVKQVSSQSTSQQPVKQQPVQQSLEF